MEHYIATFIGLVDGMKLTTLMALLLANWIIALAVSIKSGTFRLKELADLMRSRVVPYILGYLAIGVVATIDTAWESAVPIAWAVILAALVGAIIQNLKELGINIPNPLGG